MAHEGHSITLLSPVITNWGRPSLLLSRVQTTCVVSKYGVMSNIVRAYPRHPISDPIISIIAIPTYHSMD
jgi:hypothetical protein